MKGFKFSGFRPDEQGKTPFETLLQLFLELLTYTSGDVGEALQWLNQLDRQYELTSEEYGMGARSSGSTRTPRSSSGPSCR